MDICLAYDISSVTNYNVRSPLYSNFISRAIKTYYIDLNSSYLYNITSFSFNIYFGWITVATVANFTGYLFHTRWFWISHELWTL